MGVTEAEAGRYDCRLGADTLCSYNITVDTARCAAPSKSNDYQKVYSDWCHEFEKYKSAMKTWERRQLVSWFDFLFCFATRNGSIVFDLIIPNDLFLFEFFVFNFSNATRGRMTIPAATRTPIRTTFILAVRSFDSENEFETTTKPTNIFNLNE